jgi:hypothetical protein
MNLQTGAEFGDMTQILRNLGSCPPRLEFGAICEFSSRGNDAIYECKGDTILCPCLVGSAPKDDTVENRQGQGIMSPKVICGQVL